MVIDQRNAGASVTPASGAYTLDRWQGLSSQSSKFTIQQNAGSVTLPVGFSNYLGCTSSSAYSITSGDYFFIAHNIEGYNFSDLAWGTANAATVTLSFRVYSSLTGTFGGALRNSASSRSYPFSYTISSANTWTTISVTIAGDTSGTWIGATNGVGLQIAFSLGMGSTYNGTAGAWASANYASVTGATSVVATSGATFYITGVQLEVGTQATSFDFRDYGRELILCQRYYYKWGFAAGGSIIYQTTMHNISGTGAFGSFFLPVIMRANPTLTTSGSATDYGGYQGSTQITCSLVPLIDTSHPQTPLINYGYATSTLTVAGTNLSRGINTSGFLGFNAEL
jgi:hypothetical protein